MTKYRIEKDVLGEMKVEADKYWKAQTQRSIENFKIGIERMPESIIQSFILLKEACAKANADFDKLTKEKAEAIVSVCNEIEQGAYKDQFPLRVWQTGSGTQSNMNVNEVISGIANEKAGKELLHPNDDVNASQSSNDTFPSALHMMIVQRIEKELIPTIESIVETFKRLEDENKDIIKIGRTHLQDATPLYFWQELSGYRSMLEHNIEHLKQSAYYASEIAIGATAVGTGINCPKGFDQKVCDLLNEKTSLNYRPALNKFHSLTSKDACVMVSGALKALAANCMKIANDIRWLASGPRCGIGEIEIPANEPGSSIMPGKVNPTQSEAMTMVAVQVMGNDTTVGIAASQGNFELNVFMPVIAYNIDQSIQLLKDSIDSFNKNCLQGLKANKEKMEENLNNSLMLVTILNPVIGYEKAGQASRYAYENNCSLKEALVKLDLLSEDDYDKLVDPKKMIQE